MEYTLQTSLIAAILISIAFCTSWALDRMNVLPHLHANETRHGFIDGVRGLAAIFVYVNHAPFVLQNLGINNQNFSAWGWIYANLGSLGVQLFFCITGFLFFDRIIKAAGKIDWPQFYVARIRRIVPMYIFATAVYLLFATWAVDLDIHPTISNANLIASMLSFGFIESSMELSGFKLTPLTAATWTLVHEWRFYFVLPFITMFYLMPRLGKVFLALAVVTATIDFNVSKIVLWPYFMTGIVGALLYSRVSNFSKRIRKSCFVIAILTLLFICGTKAEGYGGIRFILGSALFFSLMVSNATTLAARPLKYLSEISYSVYLMHLPTLFLVSQLVNLFFPLEKITMTEFYSILAACACLTVCIASLTYKYVEYPFLRRATVGGRASATNIKQAV